MFELATLSGRLISGHKDMVLAIDVSSDDRFIATAAKDNTVRIWVHFHFVVSDLVRSYVKNWSIDLNNTIGNKKLQMRRHTLRAHGSCPCCGVGSERISIPGIRKQGQDRKGVGHQVSLYFIRSTAQDDRVSHIHQEST